MNNELKTELLEIAKVVNQFPASVQEEVFRLLAADLGVDPAPTKSSAAPKAASSNAPRQAPTRKTATGGSKPKAVPKLEVDHALLRALGDGFIKFALEKSAPSHAHFNVVAVHYLEKNLKRELISQADILTCYKALQRKPPKAFGQSIRDANSGDRGWLEVARGLRDIKVSYLGERMVEHDLPPAKA